MKRFAFLAVVALLSCGVGQVKAGSISVSTPWADSTMTVAGFDTSQGTLTGVSIQLSGTANQKPILSVEVAPRSVSQL